MEEQEDIRGGLLLASLSLLVIGMCMIVIVYGAPGNQTCLGFLGGALITVGLTGIVTVVLMEIRDG